MKITANLTKLLKNIGIILLVFLVISGLFTLFSSPFSSPEKVSLTQLAEKVNQEQVKEITVTGNKLSVVYEDEKEARSVKEEGVALSETLKSYGAQPQKLSKVNVKAEQKADWGWLGIVALGIAPLLIFGFFFWMMFKQAKGKSMKAMDFSKTKARLFGEEGKTPEEVSFDDVGGLEEAKDELDEVVEFLKNPKKFLKMGAQIPRGVLLMGPPGTGKTLLAKAIAHQADVPFYSISGSEFIELFVGVGASVTGDTPILVRDENLTKLVPIEQFVDQYYEDEQGEEMVPVSEVETLGYKPLDTNFNGASGKSSTKFFGESDWQEIEGVYRHKVDHIYEIDYLGGKLRATGDHSVFIRSNNFITAKPVRELEEGDILVNLPFKVRGKFKAGVGTTHKVKSHRFKQKVEMTLPVWNENSELEKAKEKYEFAQAKRGKISQYELAEQLGVTQGAIGNWQRGESKPRALWLAEQYLDKGIPQQVEVTPELMRLLGYYAAEGRTVNYTVQFVFGSHEKKLHRDCIDLFKELFNCEPTTEETEDNSLRISFFGKPLAKFFDKHCGTGSHNKHVPQFLWDLPQQYFLEFLKGYTRGDGYTTQENKLVAGSVSKQLILELAWLSAMHGIQVGVGEKYNKSDRVIKEGRDPLPGGKYWLLTIGKTSHPFQEEVESPKQFKKPYVQQVTKKDYDGYVYDLCGCENEAFFGGEKPTLLHNSRVRDLFDKAKKNQPSIVFIDEIDAIGRTRGAGVGGGHDEREQTLNQILSEMDGFEEKSTTVVMGATNRPDVLDPALLRPGRFDRRVTLNMPDIKAREEILKIHARKKPLTEDTDLREVAERTPGFSGADLENVVNEAAILAAQKDQKTIKQPNLLEAIERVLLGRERKSHILSDKEKKIAAYHEAGHALLASLLPEAESVRKVSIIARGPSAGGYTLKTPSEEKKMKSKSEFLAELAVLLGGYSAEELQFGEITTGASNDLKKASGLAKKLVKKYGMSELGPISYGGEREAVFLGKEMAEAKDYSEEVAAEIDGEISQFVNQAQDKATKLLKKNKELLDKIAETLIEKETIEKEEFKELVEGTKK